MIYKSIEEEAHATRIVQVRFKEETENAKDYLNSLPNKHEQSKFLIQELTLCSELMRFYIRLSVKGSSLQAREDFEKMFLPELIGTIREDIYGLTKSEGNHD